MGDRSYDLRILCLARLLGGVYALRPLIPRGSPLVPAREWHGPETVPRILDAVFRCTAQRLRFEPSPGSAPVLPRAKLKQGDPTYGQCDRSCDRLPPSLRDPLVCRDRHEGEPCAQQEVLPKTGPQAGVWPCQVHHGDPPLSKTGGYNAGLRRGARHCTNDLDAMGRVCSALPGATVDGMGALNARHPRARGRERRSLFPVPADPPREASP